MSSILNVPHQFINKIETCERRLDVYEFVQYCKALDIDPLGSYTNLWMQVADDPEFSEENIIYDLPNTSPTISVVMPDSHRNAHEKTKP